MNLLDLPDGGRLEWLGTGSGTPVTVFLHGLGGSIPDTRPFGSGVAGTRVFAHLRGHGGSTDPGTPWSYAGLAEQVEALAANVGATRALGVSMGAGALLAQLVRRPERYRRVVLVLPAALDRPRPAAALARFAELAGAVRAADLDRLTRLLLAEQPAAVRDRAEVRAWARRRAARLAGSPVAGGLLELPGQVPLADRSALAAVGAAVLVLAQPDDDAHPVAVAEELAAALPRARLHVFPAGGILWTHRAEVRAQVAGFLNAASDEAALAGAPPARGQA